MRMSVFFAALVAIGFLLAQRLPRRAHRRMRRAVSSHAMRDVWLRLATVDASPSAPTPLSRRIRKLLQDVFLPKSRSFLLTSY